MTPKIAINVIGEKAHAVLGNVASKSFIVAMDRLAILIRRKQPTPVKLASTEIMPSIVSKIIHKANDIKCFSRVKESRIR